VTISAIAILNRVGEGWGADDIQEKPIAICRRASSQVHLFGDMRLSYSNLDLD